MIQRLLPTFRILFRGSRHQHTLNFATSTSSNSSTKMSLRSSSHNTSSSSPSSTSSLFSSSGESTSTTSSSSPSITAPSTTFSGSSLAFGEFLGPDFDFSAPNRNKEILAPIQDMDINVPNITRKGQSIDSCIKLSWVNLHHVTVEKERATILYVEGLQGSGKTYFLRELSRKVKEDLNREDDSRMMRYTAVKDIKHDKYDFVGISFGSLTPIDTDDMFLSAINTRSGEYRIEYSLLIYARIYFSLFTKNTMTWHEFSKMLRKYFLLDRFKNDEIFVQELIALMHRRFYSQSKVVVLLFDDIGKIDSLKPCDVKPDTEPLSRSMMKHIRSSSMKGKCFSICLFSTCSENSIPSDSGYGDVVDYGQFSSIGKLTTPSESMADKSL